MPARKTIAAARSEQEAQRRKRQQQILLAIGAIPLAALVIIASIAVYNRVTALGPDEMPASIGSGERKDIQQAIEVYYDGVNLYNPQIAGEAMIPLDELGLRNADRMEIEIAALQAEDLKYQIQSLGATTLDAEAKRVSARVITNFGPKDFSLTRRDGQWRVAKVPDLSVPQEAGSLRLSWEITNTYYSDDGNTLFAAGIMRNAGPTPGYMLALGGFITNEAGEVLQVNRPPLPGPPFLDPGMESPFLLTFGQPAETKFDPQRIRMAPDFRPVPAGAFAQFKKKLEVTPARVPFQASGMTATVSNFEQREYVTGVFAYFRDSSGRLLSAALVWNDRLQAGQSTAVSFAPDRLRLPAALPKSVTGIASVELIATQTQD